MIGAVPRASERNHFHDPRSPLVNVTTGAGYFPDNPLLLRKGLPPFDRIRPEHIGPAVEQNLRECTARLTQLEADVRPAWDAVFPTLDEIGERFEHGWSPVSHLFSVKNSPELREAYEAALPQIVEFGLRMSQSEPIYQALKGIQQGPEWNRLTEAQRRIVEQRVRSAELAGIALQGEQRERFNDIAQQLSMLSTEFANRVLDATKAYELIVRDPADAEGWPQSLKQIAAQSFQKMHANEAAAASVDGGPWRITLEAPSYIPFMQHCRNRELRRQVYEAYIARASAGEFDNSQACVEILKLRREQARLLGFEHHAAVSLSEKMAGSVAAVQQMFDKLLAASWDPANREMQEVHELAIAAGQLEPLQHWDVPFWSERLREMTFGFREDDLRPYFPHERVLEGLFGIVNRLFGVTVVAADDLAPKWNDDVRFFHIQDESGKTIAGFYYDPYSRPEDKKSGAWMGDCLSRRITADGLTIPVAHLVCNATPAAGDIPSLMSFREVETLFHEFGHGLQHMLTKVDFVDASGINGVEWDAVELPSQFMENWCYDRPTLLNMTAHYETGEPLPEELFDKLHAARNFQVATMMLRQLGLGMIDMELHTTFDPDGAESLLDVQRRILAKTSVLPMHPGNRFLCSFQHIFAGGYAAGYYSYKWAEVLSADAFAAFVEAGLDDDAAVRRIGRKFRDTVLALGGGRHPMDVFRDFRGRDPSPDALLKQCGLA
jgi:oligopeptidase A